MCRARVSTTNLVTSGSNVLEATSFNVHSGTLLQLVLITIGLVTFLVLGYYTLRHFGFCKRRVSNVPTNSLPMYNMPTVPAPPPVYEPPRMVISHMQQSANPPTDTPLHHRTEFRSQ